MIFSSAIAVIALELLLSVQAARPVPKVILPVDEVSLEASFAAFRDELRRAAARGDLRSVLTMVAADVQATLGGRRGINALRDEWQLGRSPKECLRELQKVLTLGGRFSADRRQFTAPWPFTEFPGFREMPNYVVATEKDARVFAQPNVKSRVIERVSYAVLPFVEDPRPGLVYVTLPDGRRGFMQDKVTVWRPSETQAYFAKRDGKWLLVGFYAGID